MALSIDAAKRIIEAALLFSNEPISIKDIEQIFDEEDSVNANAIEDLLKAIMDDFRGRGIELVKVASGYRFQVCQDLAPWITRMMAEKPARYSRALLETLALVAYKQPITRAEIEDVRGVAVSTNIIRTLQEREWIKVIGHRDVPGKPALYATTKRFLDDLNLNSLSDLPTLAELQDLEDGQLKQQIDLQFGQADPAQESPLTSESESSEHAIETPSTANEAQTEPVSAESVNSEALATEESAESIDAEDQAHAEQSLTDDITTEATSKRGAIDGSGLELIAHNGNGHGEEDTSDDEQDHEQEDEWVEDDDVEHEQDDASEHEHDKGNGWSEDDEFEEEDDDNDDDDNGIDIIFEPDFKKRQGSPHESSPACEHEATPEYAQRDQQDPARESEYEHEYDYQHDVAETTEVDRY